MRTLVVACVVLVSALAGCAQNAPGAIAPASATTEAPATATPAVAAASAPHTTTVEGDATYGAGAGAVCPDGSPCSSGFLVGFALLEVKEAKPVKATLVATWTATSPLDASLKVSLASEAGGKGISATGPSPLTFDVPASALASSGTYHGQAEPPTPGAAVNEKVHLALTLDYA
jgi:hypothetical protein